MRVRHAEQALQGVQALEPVRDAGFDVVSKRPRRVRYLLWTDITRHGTSYSARNTWPAKPSALMETGSACP